MSRDESVVMLLACIDEYESTADQALRENLGYAEVIEAVRDALSGDWEGCTLH